jgi:hypothetical protein
VEVVPKNLSALTVEGKKTKDTRKKRIKMKPVRLFITDKLAMGIVYVNF